MLALEMVLSLANSVATSQRQFIRKDSAVIQWQEMFLPLGKWMPVSQQESTTIDTTCINTRWGGRGIIDHELLGNSCNIGECKLKKIQATNNSTTSVMQEPPSKTGRIHPKINLAHTCCSILSVLAPGEEKQKRRSKIPDKWPQTCPFHYR